jgi:hypothetical protein
VAGRICSVLDHIVLVMLDLIAIHMVHEWSISGLRASSHVSSPSPLVAT